MKHTKKILSIFGTRPEAIKLAPIIHELERRNIEQVVCVTAQHREMLDQMLELFDITPDYDLNIMTSGQSLYDIASKVLYGLREVLEKEKPAMVIVQGDTSTVLFGAIAAFYQKIPVAHVEAGLRTDNLYNPFPEEMNRRLVSQISELNFAPTNLSKNNLLKSGVESSKITVTGNTVIDALQWVVAQALPIQSTELDRIDFNKRIILVTSHRRENLGEGMEDIFTAIKRLVEDYDDIEVIFPVHKNPLIIEHTKRIFGRMNRVHLIEPLGYSDLANIMSKSYMIMTDSGGIQEEGPSLGKPVLVLRTTTERPEGVQAGTALLVGTSENTIYDSAAELLDDSASYSRMAKAVNPYGDGHASERIVDGIERWLKQL